MTLSSVFLILCCAFFWSLFDLSRKRLGSQLPVFQSLFLFMWVQLPLFVGAAFAWGNFNVPPEYWPLGVLGIGMNFVGNALFIASISRAPLSNTVPMLSFTCVASALVSYFILNETLGTLQWSGIALVTMGAFLLNGVPNFKNKDSSAAWLMGLASLFWGSMASIDKVCLEWVAPTLHASIQTLGIALIVSLILLKKGQLREAIVSAPRQVFNLGLGTIGSSVGILSQLYIVQFVPVGLFESVKRVFAMWFSVFWGYLLYKERMKFSKIMSMLLMALGLVMILGFSQTTNAAVVKNDHWDLAADAGYRSYPSGAALGIEGGYSHLLWGDPNKDFRYSYWRAGARLQSSGVVNRGDFKISYHPISFMALEGTYGASHRTLEEIATLNCSTLYCRDWVVRKKFSVPIYLGWQNIFARVKMEYQWLNSSQKTSLLTGDESLNMPFVSQGDRSVGADFLVGYNFSESFKLISFYEKTRMKNSQESRQSKGIMGEFSFGQHKVLSGLGLHESSFSPLHGQFFVVYSLSFAKSIGF